MIVCHSFVCRPGRHEAFYNEALELLSRASEKAFSTRSDFNRFIEVVGDALEARKPRGHRARVKVTSDMMYISPGTDDEGDVCYLQYFELRQVIAWHEGAQDFFDVADEIREGGAV